MISHIIIACLLSPCRSKAPGQPVLDGQDGEEGRSTQWKYVPKGEETPKRDEPADKKPKTVDLTGGLPP